MSGSLGRPLSVRAAVWASDATAGRARRVQGQGQEMHSGLSITLSSPGRHSFSSRNHDRHMAKCPSSVSDSNDHSSRSESFRGSGGAGKFARIHAGRPLPSSSGEVKRSTSRPHGYLDRFLSVRGQASPAPHRSETLFGHRRGGPESIIRKFWACRGFALHAVGQ